MPRPPVLPLPTLSGREGPQTGSQGCEPRRCRPTPRAAPGRGGLFQKIKTFPEMNENKIEILGSGTLPLFTLTNFVALASRPLHPVFYSSSAVIILFPLPPRCPARRCRLALFLRSLRAQAWRLRESQYCEARGSAPCDCLLEGIFTHGGLTILRRGWELPLRKGRAGAGQCLGSPGGAAPDQARQGRRPSARADWVRNPCKRLLPSPGESRAKIMTGNEQLQSSASVLLDKVFSPASILNPLMMTLMILILESQLAACSAESFSSG